MRSLINERKHISGIPNLAGFENLRGFFWNVLLKGSSSHLLIS
jgi:hypothetical protein